MTSISAPRGLTYDEAAEALRAALEAKVGRQEQAVRDLAAANPISAVQLRLATLDLEDLQQQLRDYTWLLNPTPVDVPERAA